MYFPFSLYLSSRYTLSNCSITEHNAKFCSCGLHFPGISDLYLLKNAIWKWSRPLEFANSFLKATISEVADKKKKKFQQNSNSCQMPALELSFLVIAMLEWSRCEIPNIMVMEMSTSPWSFGMCVAVLRLHYLDGRKQVVSVNICWKNPHFTDSFSDSSM